MDNKTQKPLIDLKYSVECGKLHAVLDVVSKRPSSRLKWSVEINEKDAIDKVKRFIGDATHPKAKHQPTAVVLNKRNALTSAIVVANSGAK